MATPKWTMEQLSKTVMDFGKFKGEELNDVPLAYLDWAIGNVEYWPDEELKEKIACYLKDEANQRELANELDEDGAWSEDE